ncbi:MAG: helix-turn-helix transcriptional regulator [Pleurocapsa sp. SU_196_0]|nr:helix-turn-helix transcriptional regulator [Pleurocapsa sp. SU_196_0]
MKAPSESGAWLSVENREAARALTVPREFRFVRAFMTQPRTVGEVARELGVSLLSMYRRVKHLEALGLLRVAEHVKRRGRPLKRYSVAAEAFFVPFRASPFDTLEAFMHDRQDVWQRRLIRGLIGQEHDDLFSMGLCIFCDGDGFVRVVRGSGPGKPDVFETTLDPQASATWNDWSVIPLEFDDAKALQRELFALYERYVRRPTSRTARRYILRTALAPAVDD